MASSRSVARNAAASAPALFSTPAEADAPLPPWPAAPIPDRSAVGEESHAEFDVEMANGSGMAEAESPEIEIIEEQPGSEIDLSEEWDGALSADSAVTSTDDATSAEETLNEAEIEPAIEEPAVEELAVDMTDPVAETVEEVRFYLEHSMAEQARAAYIKLQAQTADHEPARHPASGNRCGRAGPATSLRRG